MRRLLVLSLSIALVAIGAGATAVASSSATRSSSSRLIVCPLSASAVTTCCGPPLAQPGRASVVQPPFCCPQSALCAGSLTIASAPNPSTAGARVTVSGRLSGSGAPPSPVVLWQRLPGQRGFARLAQAGTAAAGRYTISWGAGTVMTNRIWYVTAGGSRSSTVNQLVRAVVTLAASASRARGAATTFRGHVSPAHAGQRVVLEQLLRGRWQAIARPRLDRRSKFTVTHRFARAGARKLRAELPGDARNIRSFSVVIKA